MCWKYSKVPFRKWLQTFDKRPGFRLQTFWVRASGNDIYFSEMKILHQCHCRKVRTFRPPHQTFLYIEYYYIIIWQRIQFAKYYCHLRVAYSFLTIHYPRSKIDYNSCCCPKCDSNDLQTSNLCSVNWKLKSDCRGFVVAMSLRVMILHFSNW